MRCVLSMSDELPPLSREAVERLIGMESVALCEAAGSQFLGEGDSDIGGH